MAQPKHRKLIGLTTTGAVVLGVALAGAPAHAAEAAPSQMRTVSATAPGGLTAAQWDAIAAIAKRAGDTESTTAAGKVAERARGGGKTYNLMTDLAKRAIVAALRHGGSKLPGPLSKWSSKIVGVVEDIEAIEQKPLTMALMSAGIPASDAYFIVQWCVTFAGL